MLAGHMPLYHERFLADEFASGASRASSASTCITEQPLRRPHAALAFDWNAGLPETRAVVLRFACSDTRTARLATCGITPAHADLLTTSCGL
jgi:hypothetical protein